MLDFVINWPACCGGIRKLDAVGDGKRGNRRLRRVAGRLANKRHPVAVAHAVPVVVPIAAGTKGMVTKGVPALVPTAVVTKGTVTKGAPALVPVAELQQCEHHSQHCTVIAWKNTAS